MTHSTLQALSRGEDPISLWLTELGNAESFHRSCNRIMRQSRISQAALQALKAEQLALLDAIRRVQAAEAALDTSTEPDRLHLFFQMIAIRDNLEVAVRVGNKLFRRVIDPTPRLSFLRQIFPCCKRPESSPPRFYALKKEF